jgi:hypothetical protein
MVVLAMHIRRDRAAEGDEFRARRDQEEPAALQEGRDNVRQEDPGLGHQRAGGRVEGQHAVHARHPERQPG